MQQKKVENYKQTPFFEIHKSLNARILPFAGYYMPIEYTSINEEHINVRTNAGIFDVSHMGEIWIKGNNSYEFLQWVLSNDISILTPGKAQYNYFPNHSGGIVDDLIVYKFDENEYLLVVNASNIEKDYNWLINENKYDVTIINDSDNYAQLAIQGPKAIDILQQITNSNLKNIPYYSFTIGNIGNVSNVIISNTGYTGSGGFELYFTPKDATYIWNTIIESGKEHSLRPAGLGARDTLRTEMGYLLYGNDINDNTSPIQAGLAWITKFAPYKNFINKANLYNEIKNGTKQKLVHFKMIDKGIPRHNYEIKNSQGETIGIVTSGTMSPILKEGIGMGYVLTEYSSTDNIIFINIRDRLLKAKIVKAPFVKTNIS